MLNAQCNAQLVKAWRHRSPTRWRRMHPLALGKALSSTSLGASVGAFLYFYSKKDKAENIHMRCRVLSCRKRWRHVAASHNYWQLQIRTFSAQKDELCRIAVEALTANLAAPSKSSKSANKRYEKVAGKARKGALSFYNHFEEIYGKDRWPQLCQALLCPPRMGAVVNPFFTSSTSTTDWKGVIEEKHLQECEEQQQSISVERLEWAKPLEAYWIDFGATRIPAPTPMNNKFGQSNGDVAGIQQSSLLDYYCLDPSSILPVLALNLANAGEEPVSVLDMCAAPGGKALGILQALTNDSTSSSTLGGSMLVVNEVSDSRRKRLRRVLDQYLPQGVVGPSVYVTGRDGVGFGKHIKGDLDYGVKEELFSHVLCDVPCSGERHVLQNGRALGQFKPGTSKRNQKRQIALLKAAVAACRPDGIIVYSTCSIEPDENDQIVEKILSKRKDMVDLFDELSFRVGEPTKHGWIVLPDHPSCTGLGPMYIATLRRKNI